MVGLGDSGVPEGLWGRVLLPDSDILWMTNTESPPAFSEVHPQGKYRLDPTELDEVTATRGKGSLLQTSKSLSSPLTPPSSLSPEDGIPLGGVGGPGLVLPQVRPPHHKPWLRASEFSMWAERQ